VKREAKFELAFARYEIRNIMVEKITNFRDLDVWKKGIEIVKLVYKTTNSFPQQELYGLASQMQRSSVSIPSNIAQKSNKDT
jgi:hypothetical protein